MFGHLKGSLNGGILLCGTVCYAVEGGTALFFKTLETSKLVDRTLVCDYLGERCRVELLCGTACLNISPLDLEGVSIGVSYCRT